MSFGFVLILVVLSGIFALIMSIDSAEKACAKIKRSISIALRARFEQEVRQFASRGLGAVQ